MGTAQKLRWGFLALALLTMPAGAADKGVDGKLPVHLAADQVTHDRELGVITASGNVEIAHGDRILQADTVAYNERQDVVAATGNVRLLEPTGDVLFGEYMELTSDMANGFVKNLRMTHRTATPTGARSPAPRTVRAPRRPRRVRAPRRRRR